MKAVSKHKRSSKLDRIKQIMTKVMQADARAAKSRRRFAQYRYLRAVYRGYCVLEEERSLKRLRKYLLRHYDVSEEAHAIRMIIDATATEPDRQLRSRWTRALEFAWNQKVEPDDLLPFIRRNKGLTGCAHLAARALPIGKRRTPRDDFADDGFLPEPYRYERERWISPVDDDGDTDEDDD